MSQVKRICAALLAIMMLMSFLTVSAFAATPAGMEVTTDGESIDKLKAGDTVTVKLTLPVMDKLAGAQIELGFDKSSFEFQEKTQFDEDSGTDVKVINTGLHKWNPTITDKGTANTIGIVAFNAVGTTNRKITTEGFNLLTIEFKVLDGASGSAQFSVNLFNLGYIDSEYHAQPITDVTAPLSKTVTILKAPISSVSFTLDKPTQGAALPSLSGLGSGYTGAVEWYEGTSATGAAATDNAKPNTKYTAKVTLTAKPGESFADSVSIPTDYTKVSADATTIVLTKTFDATDSLPAATVTAAPTAKSLKYNGSDQELVNAGTTPDGTMQYSLNGTTWSTAIPKGKDAKTYTVYYMVKGNSDHTDFIPTSNTVSVTIEPKNIADSTVKIDSIPNQVYDGGNELKPLPVVKDGTTPLVKGTDYTVSYTNNTNAGTATLTIKGKGNYTGTKAANFTIVAADQNPTFTTPKDLVKGGHKLDLTTLVQGAKGDMIFAIASGTTFATLSGHELTSTIYTGTVKINVSIAAKDVDGDGNNEYKAYTGTNAITVNVVDKPINTTTMKVSQGDITYGESVSPSVTNKPDGTDTVRYTYEGRDGTTYSNSAAPTNVGKYKVKATCESSTTIYTAEDTFEILAKSISGMTVTLNNTSLEYNGSAQAVTVTVKDGGTTLVEGTGYTVTGKTSGTNVGNYTVTVTGKGNYTDSVEKTWKIIQGTPTYTAPTGLTATFGQTLANVNIAATTGWSWMDSTQSVGDASTTPKTFKAKFTPADTTNYKTVENIDVPVTVNKKAKIETLPDITYNLLYTTTSTQVANVGRADMPEDAGTLTYAKGPAPMLVPVTGSTTPVVGVMSWNVDSATGTVEYQLTAGSVGEKVRFPVVISSTNYENSTVFVAITLINKDDVSGKITFPDGKLVYNGNSQKYEKATISIAPSGTAKWTYNYLPITGTTANLNTDNLPLTVGKYTVVATYEDDTQFGTKSATLEITPAKPTGTPTFTKITEKGKTLADANLGMGTLTPTGGTLEWVAGDTTVVEANKAYEWKYTPAPADAVNYAPVTGTIMVYPVSTGIVIYSPCYTIKASAGVNGTISPAGWCSVAENGSQTFTFTPDKGYSVAKVLVDGKSVGAVKSYTFKDVTKDHTIEVIFMKSNGNPATGAFVMP